jgi:NAD+ kinase
MHTPLHPPTRFAIGIHPDLSGVEDTSREIFNVLQKKGFQPLIMGSLYNEDLRRSIEKAELDVLIALGGDGTMLRAGRICAPYRLPVLGINLGHFGFLMEIDQYGWQELLPRLIDGNYMIENRMMLHCEHWRGEVLCNEWEALNDVVVSRGAQVRPIRLSAEIDGYPLTNYVADGLIVATPTGSTAYALAVQGPVLSPELRNILVAPVAPHLSVDRTIVLSAESSVRVVVHTYHEAVISPDGRNPTHLEDGDVIKVRASQNEASFVRLCDPGYFYHNLTRYLEHNPSAGSL